MRKLIEWGEEQETTFNFHWKPLNVFRWICEITLHSVILMLYFQLASFGRRGLESTKKFSNSISDDFPEPFFSQWFIWIMGRPGKILHGWESWNKKWIIALIGCQCSKSLHPCHKPHKCLCFWKFMVYWATVASGFDSTTTASSNSFKSIGDWPLILKGKERGLKILKVSISWMLRWQLYFMKWLFYTPGFFFFFSNNSLLPQENQKIRNGIRTCRSGRALIFLQEGSRMNENVLSWLYIFFTPNISRTW